MKINELNRCLQGKLQMEQREGSRHWDYQLRCAGRILGLPTLLRVSHGSGDLTRTNLSGVAKALGLNEHALREMEGCRISRACMLLCLATNLLAFVHRQKQEQGEIFRPGALAMVQSVEVILKEPEFRVSIEWRPSERRALTRALGILKPMSSDSDLGAIVLKLVDRMNRG